MSLLSSIRTPLVVFTLAAGVGSAAVAHGVRGLPLGTPADYTNECGSCHVAYPPALLPAASWARLMAGLDTHYGSDASLDAATLARLGRWLQAEAGTGRRAGVAPPEDRISRAPWFLRTHRKVDAPVWALPSVRSAANCGACHAGASRGVYDDDDLTAPPGVTPRQRRAFSD